jgi:hypothetical protein
MGRNTHKWLNGLYKIMNKGPRAPFSSSSSLSLSFFLSFPLFSPLVYHPLLSPFLSSFIQFLPLSFHGPIWASSNGPVWAWCIGFSPLFFWHHNCLPVFAYSNFLREVQTRFALQRSRVKLPPMIEFKVTR